MEKAIWFSILVFSNVFLLVFNSNSNSDLYMFGKKDFKTMIIELIWLYILSFFKQKLCFVSHIRALCVRFIDFRVLFLSVCATILTYSIYKHHYSSLLVWFFRWFSECIIFYLLFLCFKADLRVILVLVTPFRIYT